MVESLRFVGTLSGEATLLHFASLVKDDQLLEKNCSFKSKFYNPIALKTAKTL